MQRLIERIKSLIKVGVVRNPRGDTGRFRAHQVMYRGKLVNAVRVNPYGLHSVPDIDDYVVLIENNANAEEHLSISANFEEAPNGQPGDVFLFHPKTGAKVWMDSDGKVWVDAVDSVEIISPSVVKITTPTTEISADLDVEDNVGIGGDLEVTGTTNLLGALDHDGSTAGFYGTAPIVKPSITGSTLADRLVSTIAALEALGLATDNTT